MPSWFAPVTVAAIGVALSPLPIVAVLVILLTRRARMGSLVFCASWIVGNALAISVGIIFARQVHAPRIGQDYPSEALVTLLLGIGLIVTAAISRRGRRRSGSPDAPPRWVAAVDNVSPTGGALLALSNAMTSPKNLAFAIGAGLAIRQATPWPAEQFTAGLVYVAISSLTVLAPVVVYFVAGERATPVLTRWKQRLTMRAAAGMEVMLFVLGIGLAVRGITNLLA